ncbi:MAG TPA: tetratricopeptide repeat protein [Bacteroidia bacterium]|nr:tetratricopeptide repeat protein [Bacteroidia bacterium]
MKNTILVLTATVLFCACTQNAVNEKELQAQNQRSDSISIQLNSPELKALNNELVDDANNPELYFKRAKLYLSLKQFEEALADAALAIKLDSTRSDFYMTRVDACFAMNNTRMAKETLLSMETKFPDNSEVLLKLAELYFLVKRYQDAITYVNKSLKLDEGQAKAYHLKGTVYRETGDTAKAISSFQTAIEQDNRFSDAYYDLGLMYASRKNPLAIDYYTNALKIDPSNMLYRYALAMFLQQLGKTDEAVQEYRNNLERNKNCDQCAYNLGAIYLEIKKDNANALAYFTKAIEINPNYLDAYFARAFTYAGMGNRTAARADYQMCLKLEPNYEAAVQGLNNLGKN